LVVESLVAKNVNEVTYNFTVGDFHTYFVGGQRALVHNCSRACSIDGFKEHLTLRDLVAARREAAGEVVARKADGTPWDHINEVREAQAGLLNRIEIINKRLSNPNIPESQKTGLRETLSEASKLLDRSEEFLPR